MAWTTPPTLSDGTVLTGAHTQIWRDDLNETAPAKATAAGQIFVSTGTNAIAARTPQALEVATSETTSNTSYVALTTPGPAVTVTCGTTALVGISANLKQNTNTAFALASYAVSGATTVAAADGVSVQRQFATASGDNIRASVVMLKTGLTPGSNTFTMQYRVTSGTGTFADRSIFVIPF